MIAELKRIEETADGTIGILLLDKNIQCFILENKNLLNKPFTSCIPAGIYQCRKKQSPKFNEVFEVCDVPGRYDILIHVGNTADDTSGYMLPGERTGFLNGNRAVLGSGKALRELMEVLCFTDEFKLIITECF